MFERKGCLAMKVMIADDEAHICSLIKHLINWKELNLEFAGFFANGIEVLDFFEDQTADVLICDIEMPGMNGIELMAKLSQIKPELKIIVISGFRNFEYAHNAMKYGVTNYLLKPIDEKELNEVLESITTSSKKEEYTDTAISKASERLQLIEILNGTQAAGDLKSVNAKYHYEFREGMFNVIKVVFSGVDSNSEYMALTMKMFTDILRPKLADFCYDSEFFRVNAASMYVILNYPADKTRAVQTTLGSMLQNTIIELGCKTQSKCFIGVGISEETFKDVVKSYKFAKNMVCERLVNSSKRIFYAEFVNGRYFETESEYISQSEKRTLHRIVEGIDFNEAALWVKRLFAANEKKLLARPWLAFEYCARILELLFSILDDMEISLVDKEIIIQQKKLILHACESVDEVERIMTDIVVGQIKEKLTEKIKNTSVYVQQAKNYIERNYDKTVTLEKMASELHINPTYLSIVFKNETNINYSKYLTMVRMEKAKELLKDCSKNLTQVANAVGYDRTSYFSKLFKKYTGLKPNEYQRLHQHDIGL